MHPNQPDIVLHGHRTCHMHCIPNMTLIPVSYHPNTERKDTGLSRASPSRCTPRWQLMPASADAACTVARAFKSLNLAHQTQGYECKPSRASRMLYALCIPNMTLISGLSCHQNTEQHGTSLPHAWPNRMHTYVTNEA
jgi:hypothetical protein